MCRISQSSKSKVSFRCNKWPLVIPTVALMILSVPNVESQGPGRRRPQEADKHTTVNGAANTSGGQIGNYPPATQPNYRGVDTSRPIYYDPGTGQYYAIRIEMLPSGNPVIISKTSLNGYFQPAEPGYKQPTTQEASYNIEAFNMYDRVPEIKVKQATNSWKGSEVPETLKSYAFINVLAAPKFPIDPQTGSPASPLVTYHPDFKFQDPQDAISSSTTQDGQLFLVQYQLDGDGDFTRSAIMREGEMLPAEWNVITVERVGKNKPIDFMHMSDDQIEKAIENSQALKQHKPSDFEKASSPPSDVMESNYSRYQRLVVAIQYGVPDKFSQHRENKELQITFLGTGDGYIYGLNSDGQLVFIHDENIQWVSPDPSIETRKGEGKITVEPTGERINTPIVVVGKPIYGERR